MALPSAVVMTVSTFVTGARSKWDKNTLDCRYRSLSMSLTINTFAFFITTIVITTITITMTVFVRSQGTRREQPGGSPGAALTLSPPPGLAVHQIITITVSLIMVIAALITTLVLKNCCAQSGNTRRNSHQRKTNQQEESCQNLTDFTPARVPSSMDIFTAYNETLQCSHECVRASVPVYTDETLHPSGEYKSTFNGNRSSSADRHLIPVAFVSEKWFEISC
ncbi:adherens junctions associated protein 1 [Ictidomys tridecemlineatus]|uniref:adherens junction-associated protein 1 n=1 Tax=Ictidomys tridecemlineatus TaxID=43179 RepID=UPI00038C10E5|nr:adherens junction-associated protein 1 [Ictidomys tridecemlineatus]KAG3281995.1 adherens junctions associated protein 1 [Ictidomys tridecemlineatus]